MRRRLLDAFVPVALLLAVVLLYRKVTWLWWTWDDSFLLHIAAEHTPRDYFLSGALWLWMPQQLFTPLLTASYDAELALFGPSPALFYIVHLAELALIAIALFLTLRFWLSPAASACAAMLFVCGVPLCTLATQLMLVHYLESVLLAIVSVALFAAGRPVLSAVVYLCAMLAKEIAVPLPVVLVMVSATTLRRLAPHAVALLVYVGWRWALLGKLVGGYAWVFTPAELPALVGKTIVNIVKTFAGPVLPLGVALLLLLAAGIAAAFRSRRAALRIIVAFVVALAPILPVMKQYEKRFALTSWLCAVVVFAVGADALRNRRLRAALLIAAPLVCIAANRQEWADVFPRAKRMSDEGRVFAGLGGGDFLRKPSIPPGTMYQLEWIKENLLGGTAGSLWFFDDLYLCTHARPRRIFGYDEPSRTVVDMTPRMESIAAGYCASIRDGAPLSVHFHQQDGLLRWDLGPYDRGAYGMVVDNGFLSYDIARRDVLQMTSVKSLTMRVRYQSPEGWVTYSPELALDFTKEQDLVWRR